MPGWYPKLSMRMTMIEGLGEGWPVTNLGVTMKALGGEIVLLKESWLLCY